MVAPANPTALTPPRVAFLDPRTGAISREWYRFLLSLVTATESNTNESELLPDAVSLASSLEDQLDTLAQTVEIQPRNELGTISYLQQDNVPWLTFSPVPSNVPVTIGTAFWDGGQTLNLQQTLNVAGKVNEDNYYYIKADSTISKGQLVMFTGSVGASGVLRGAPATGLGINDGVRLMGVAAENIAANGFGLVQWSGTLRGFNTTGSPYGETWADGDILYYNPAYAGGLTKVEPTAPNVRAVIATVIKAGSGGSGSVSIRLSVGSVLGGTDSNVYINALTNGDVLQYDGVQQRWENTPIGSLGVGTVTSINVSGGTTGLTTSGGPITTSGTITLAGTLNVANGGTGATTATAARTNLGATTVGSNFFTLTNPSAVTFLRINADNSVSTLDAATFRTAIGAGTGNGTVTSVSGTGTVNGITLTGTVTSSGSLTLGGTLSGVSLTTQVSGTLPTANGGTNLTSFTANGVLYASSTSALTTGSALTFDGTNFVTTGTASATKFIPTGGTATGNGMYLPASNTLAFSTNGSEKVRIASDGSLLVGTTASLGGNTRSEFKETGAGTWPLVLNGDDRGMVVRNSNATSGFYAYFEYAGGTNNGSISWTGGTTAYNTTSDARIKDNITDAPDAGDLIDGIKVRSWDFKADGAHWRYGMVAQELLAVAPEAVNVPADPDMMMGVDYSKLVPMLIKEVQSLRARVAQLENV